MRPEDDGVPDIEDRIGVVATANKELIDVRFGKVVKAFLTTFSLLGGPGSDVTGCGRTTMAVDGGRDQETEGGSQQGVAHTSPHSGSNQDLSSSSSHFPILASFSLATF